jgi:hypothetical protein
MTCRRYLTPKEVVERYRETLSEQTLANWRSMKIGPRYTKVGKAVLYREDDLDAWDDANSIGGEISAVRRETGTDD